MIRPSCEVQQQIQYEVETNLQAPFASAPRTLYELLDLRDLEASSADQIVGRWNHFQLQPDYKNFVRQWDQASGQKKAGVGFRYALLYQEIKILEKVADLRGIALKRTDVATCTTHGAPQYGHRSFGCNGKEAEIPVSSEKMRSRDRRQASAVVAKLRLIWQRGKAWLDWRALPRLREPQGYSKIS